MSWLSTIIAVFRVTQRRIVNTRAFIWMLVAILLTNGALPFYLSGDGSSESMLKLLIIYPPTLMFCILLAGSLWSAAAISAQDIDSGAFSAIIAKPAPLSTIWLGKWLGLLALNAMLLVVGCAALWTAITLRSHASPAVTTAILDGHAAFYADDAMLREEAAARQLAHQLTGQTVPEIGAILNQVKTEAFRISPGAAYTWEIPLATNEHTGPAGENATWSLQFRFHCAALERTPINGSWTIRSSDNAERTIPVNNLLDGQHQVPLPPVPYQGTVSVTFSNSLISTTTTFFSPSDPVTILRRDTLFGVNLLRSFLVLFCFLAATTALALSLGTLFSFPVAVFSALALVLALMLSHAFAAIPSPAHGHGAETVSHHAINQAGEWMLTQLHKRTASTLQLMPLRQLANGRRIERRQCWQATIWLLFFLPGFLCLISCLHLKRREFPR